MNVDITEKLPKTVEKELFITLVVSGYDVGKIGVWDCNIPKYDSGYILLKKQKVTFKLPQDINVKGKVIESLESEKEKIKADFHMQLKDVQDKIDNLLAIEYKPT